MKRIAVCGMFTALSLLFSYVELLFPAPIPIPGIKLGLANSLIVIVLYGIGDKEALLVSFCRVLLSALLFGSMASFFYAIAGAGFSFLGMVIMKHCFKSSLMASSTAGGFLHNTGQLMVAALLVGIKPILFYIPVLLLIGIGMGMLIGLISREILKHVVNVL